MNTFNSIQVGGGGRKPRFRRRSKPARRGVRARERRRGEEAAFRVSPGLAGGGAREAAEAGAARGRRTAAVRLGRSERRVEGVGGILVIRCFSAFFFEIKIRDTVQVESSDVVFFLQFLFTFF